MKVKVYTPDAHAQDTVIASSDSMLAREVIVDGHSILVMVYGKPSTPTAHLIAVARVVDLMPILCAFPNKPDE